MQTKADQTPEGFIAQEFQEWMRLIVIPRCQGLAAYFNSPRHKKCYDRLQRDLDWDEQHDGACYMLALDKDKRHTMTDMQHYRYTRRGTGKGELRDRRTLDINTWGWMQLSEKQVVPAGPKQCDTVQQPVELVMSQVKREARKLLPLVGTRTGSMLIEAVNAAAEKVTVENVASYWRHAKKAIQVWSARDSEVVNVWLSRNNYKEAYQFMGTHGGIVHKELRG
jgi:hypothetical protein